MEVQILYDSTYMRSLEESDSERQEVEWWLRGVQGGRNESWLMVWDFHLGR